MCQPSTSDAFEMQMTNLIETLYICDHCSITSWKHTIIIVKVFLHMHEYAASNIIYVSKGLCMQCAKHLNVIELLKQRATVVSYKYEFIIAPALITYTNIALTLLC
jgi:hypothetical protein